MIQHETFSTGGFVLHKIPESSVKCSAWFTAAGFMTSAERFDSLGRSYNVKRNTPLWAKLRRYGRIYKES